jgi:tetratricopeptide (TPR) repeat protein
MHRLVRVLAFLLLVPAVADAYQRDAESAKRWHEDIAYFRRELPRRHIHPFHDLSREQFDAMTAELDGRIESLRDSEIIVGLARIVAHLGARDGHSRINLLNPAVGFHAVPLNLYAYADGLFIRAASAAHQDLLGARVIAINGIPAEEALARANDIAPGDNAMSRLWWAPNLLILPEVLQALHIGDRDPAAAVSLDLEGIDKSRKKVDVEPVKSLDGTSWEDVRRRAPQPAMYRRWAALDPLDRHGAQKPFWYEYLADRKLLYVNFSEVSDAPDETVAAFFGRVYAFADAHPVDKFVIDIRNNGGGNNYLNRPVVYGLISRAATIGRRGTLFAITGRETFSAAQNLANQLEMHTNAIFVGEPTGGSPNHYGDTLAMRLPNSKVPVQLSSVWWQDLDPRDFRTTIAPDVAAELTSADDRLGRDPTLEAILSYQPETPVATLVRDALARGGKPEAQRVLQVWRAEPRHKFARIEDDLNTLGAGLFGEKKSSDAVIVFELAAELYPDSWRAQNNVGRAYVAVDRKPEALAAFRRALAIRPNAPQTLSAMDGL